MDGRACLLVCIGRQVPDASMVNDDGNLNFLNPGSYSTG